VPEELLGRHIAFLNWRDLDHPEAGGAEVHCTELAHHLLSRGARVTLVTSRAPGQRRTDLVDGLQITRAGGRFGVYPAALAWLARHRKTVDAVVDCQNGIPFFSPLVSGRRMPIVQVVHHVHQKQFPLYFSPRMARVGQFLERVGSRIVYRRRPLAVVSPSTRREVRTELGLPGPRFLVPNGVRLPPLPDPQARTPTPSIVCVGRLVPHKRYHLLLDALADLGNDVDDLVVDIVGDGPAQAALQEQARALPAGLVRWHGRLSDADRDALLANAWLTVNPSHGEGWGLSVVEAASFGVPTLAFRVQGIQDAVLDGRTGWLVPEGQPLAAPLARAIEQLRDEAAAQRFAETARAWAGGFSWARSGDLLANLLAAEINLRRSRRSERRRQDDDAVVATLPPDQTPRVRATDLVFCETSGSTAVLLYGARAADVPRILARTGLTATSVRTADDADLLTATRSFLTC
jgi:glycosyltransferase involved in cell wall biosynthesis